MQRLRKTDKDKMAEFILDTYNTRKRKRQHLEKLWEDIDRQLRMEPDTAHKKKPNGEWDQRKSWLAETELPGQAQTLEITLADFKRMRKPSTGPWFAAHAAMTDDYLAKADFRAIIAGDQNDVPTQLNQDNADKLVQSLIMHWEGQYDFNGNMNLIGGEAIKYSIGLGRVRLAQKRVFLHSTQGVIAKDQTIPILVPRSIKCTYLDDSAPALQNEGHIVSPGQIWSKTMRLKDVQMAAAKGNSDVNDINNGGWIKSSLKALEPDDKGNIKFLEWEGDIVVPRTSTESLYLPNAIITVVDGHNNSRAVVRIRKNSLPFSSYIEFPYNKENIDSAYGTSPLMKGFPLQFASVGALNRTMESGAMNTQPPAQYDADDQDLVAAGGPTLFPGASIGSTGDIKPLMFGDPAALYGIYQGLQQQYKDVTGTDSARLGGQTISHTTAYAKDAELSRGSARTVDFVTDTLEGPLTRWLNICYKIGRDSMKKTTMYVPSYRGFVTVDKSMMPEQVFFEAHGAGAPQEEQQKVQARMAALNQALTMDQLQVSMGGQPKIDLASAIEQVLTEGGWMDTDAILVQEEPQGPPQEGMPQQGVVDPGMASTAMQGLNFGS